MRILATTLLLASTVSLAPAAEEAARLDPLKGKTVAHWIDRLGSDRFDEREEATQALTDAGEAAVPALKQALESHDDEVRQRAQSALNALAAVAALASPLKGKTVAHWIDRLGSDIFDEREEATQTLADAGEAVVPALKKALENRDHEVRLRARLALTALVTLSIEGQFVRIKSESYGPNGQRTVQSNEAGESTLDIEKGRVTFKQDYSKGVEQVYSFPESTSLSFRKKCSIELNWESINVGAGYNPDSKDPQLECANTIEGLRITLSAKDTVGTSFKMIYVTKADAEKEHLRRPRNATPVP